MNAEEIDMIAEKYEQITSAIERAIEDNRDLVDKGDRWLARLISSGDIKDFSTNVAGTLLYGSANVWTVQTGGSNERVEFTIPLDTLNEYL